MRIKLIVTQFFLLVEIWIEYLKIDNVLTKKHYLHWKRLLKNNSSSTRLSAEQQQHMRTIINLSEKVGRHHIKKMNCMRRSLTQKKLLEKRDIYPQLKIGVQLQNGELKAHAWLTMHNECLNDSVENVNKYKLINTEEGEQLLTGLVKSTKR